MKTYTQFITELRDSTLSSYINKAAKSAATNSDYATAKYHSAQGMAGINIDFDKKVRNRLKGIKTAVQKKDRKLKNSHKEITQSEKVISRLQRDSIKHNNPHSHGNY